MRRGSIGAAVAFLLVGVAATSSGIRSCAHRRAPAVASAGPSVTGPTDEAALARVRSIPLYRALLSGGALRAASVDGHGTLNVEVDLRAVVEPRLAALGYAGASELLPASAKGTIVIEAAAGLRESWTFDGPTTLFDLLDRRQAGEIAPRAVDAIPGAPTAAVRMRLLPQRLADPSFGGATLAAWQDRASFAEKLIGRSLRAELAEDLAGPAVFALYETADDTEADAILVLELRRSDRVAGLLDMVFGLGALTERATVQRYRGVATGSFRPGAGGPGVALAVDGPLLIVATSRARLEAAIDARRAGPHRGGVLSVAGDPGASWHAVSASAFVAHGWARLARAVDARPPSALTTTASLKPEGESGWRLEGHGPTPAIAADPTVPFLRSVLFSRQREGD